MTSSTPYPDGSADADPSRTLLTQLDDWLATGPVLHAMADRRFLQALEAFEGSSSQRTQIAEKLSGWSTPTAGELRWLSIGCGGGDLDVRVATALAERHERQHYVGVDPNPIECARCRSLFEELPESIEATVVAQPFEDFEGRAASFDLIYATHTFYYVDDVEQAVRSVRRLLRPGGELLILHAPLGGLNELANRFWEARLGRGVPYSATIEQRLKSQGSPLRRFRIEAELDVTHCMIGDERATERGRAVLDFILQLDTRLLPREIQRHVCDYLFSISRLEGGRRLVPHPVDGFIMKPHLDEPLGSPGPQPLC